MIALLHLAQAACRNISFILTALRCLLPRPLSGIVKDGMDFAQFFSFHTRNIPKISPFGQCESARLSIQG